MLFYKHTQKIVVLDPEFNVFLKSYRLNKLVDVATHEEKKDCS
jgi:hypothetical protein